LYKASSDVNFRDSVFQSFNNDFHSLQVLKLGKLSFYIHRDHTSSMICITKILILTRHNQLMERCSSYPLLWQNVVHCKNKQELYTRWNASGFHIFDFYTFDSNILDSVPLRAHGIDLASHYETL
jgi:hypothetical protein